MNGIYLFKKYNFKTAKAREVFRSQLNRRVGMIARLWKIEIYSQ